MVAQVFQIIAKGVGGVKVVLGEGEGASRSGGPGIHHGSLYHVVLFRTAPNEAAALLHHDVHFGPQVKSAAEVRRLLAHDGRGDYGIDLDAGYILAARGDGVHDIRTTAWTNDEGLGGRAQ